MPRKPKSLAQDCEEEHPLVGTECHHPPTAAAHESGTSDDHPAMRSSGSAALSLIQLVALISFLAGGITILALSKKRADDDMGEVPLYWYTTPLSGERVHAFNMSPGYPLGAAMLFMFVMYTIDLLALYPNWYLWCAKKINPKSSINPVELSKDTAGERRYDANRTTRRYWRLAPTWAILMMVLHLATGEYSLPKLLMSTVVAIACLVNVMNALNSSNTVHHFMSKNNKTANNLLLDHNVEMFAQATSIGTNTIWSAVFMVFSFLSMLVDWKYNRDDPGTFITSRTDGAVMMFTVVFGVYWLGATTSANAGLASLQSYALQPIAYLFSTIGMLTSFVFNGGFIEEFVTTVVDLVFFGVISYLAYTDIIDSRATVPL